jgi:hypothetical protein
VSDAFIPDRPSLSSRAADDTLQPALPYVIGADVSFRLAFSFGWSTLHSDPTLSYAKECGTTDVQVPVLTLPESRNFFSFFAFLFPLSLDGLEEEVMLRAHSAPNYAMTAWDPFPYLGHSPCGILTHQVYARPYAMRHVYPSGTCAPIYTY